MAITLDAMTKEGFRSDYPITEKASKVKVGPGKWSLKARVKLSGEDGKRFRVGFVQAQYVNVVSAVYKKTNYREVPRNPLPVLDGSRSEPPFYTKNVATTPKVDGTAGDVLVDCELWDRPETDLLWFHAGDAQNPLEGISLHLKFHTWLAVQEVTGAGPHAQTFAAVLKEWKIVVKHDYTVDITKPTGSRLTQTTNGSSMTVISPTTTPPGCVWVPTTACYNYDDVYTPIPVPQQPVTPAPLPQPAVVSWQQWLFDTGKSWLTAGRDAFMGMSG